MKNGIFSCGSSIAGSRKTRRQASSPAQLLFHCACDLLPSPRPIIPALKNAADTGWNTSKRSGIRMPAAQIREPRVRCFLFSSTIQRTSITSKDTTSVTAQISRVPAIAVYAAVPPSRAALHRSAVIRQKPCRPRMLCGIPASSHTTAKEMIWIPSLLFFFCFKTSAAQQQSMPNASPISSTRCPGAASPQMFCSISMIPNAIKNTGMTAVTPVSFVPFGRISSVGICCF